MPIIGPPEMIFAGFSLTPPQSSNAVRNSVPKRKRKLPDFTSGVPVTVVTRSYNGFPRHTASQIAAVVATFETTQFTAAGRPPLGTVRPVTA